MQMFLRLEVLVVTAVLVETVLLPLAAPPLEMQEEQVVLAALVALAVFT